MSARVSIHGRQVADPALSGDASTHTLSYPPLAHHRAYALPLEPQRLMPTSRLRFRGSRCAGFPGELGFEGRKVCGVPIDHGESRGSRPEARAAVRRCGGDGSIRSALHGRCRKSLQQCRRRLADGFGPATTTAQWHALAGFCSVEPLDTGAVMRRRVSVAKAGRDAPGTDS